MPVDRSLAGSLELTGQCVSMEAVSKLLAKVMMETKNYAVPTAYSYISLLNHILQASSSDISHVSFIGSFVHVVVYLNRGD